jgi:hypothetical protein
MLEALIPQVALVIMLTASFGYFADNATLGPNQHALFLSM